MTPFESYQAYLSIKRHFKNKNYDCLKYNYKIRTNIDTFNKRKDKFLFEKIAKLDDPKNFLLANILNNDNIYPRDIVYNENSKIVYKDWQKTIQSLTYTVKNDLDMLEENFDDNFKVFNNEHPKLLKLHLSKKIKLETLVILCDLVGCLRLWNNKLQNDPVWESLSMKIEKYIPLLHYDKEKIRQIVIDKFSL
jgi:hypothetical protein